MCVCFDSEKSRFSLKGLENQGQRFRIYKFLLKHFTDEQRFNITTRISQDVLGKVSEEDKECIFISVSFMFQILQHFHFVFVCVQHVLWTRSCL